MYNSNCLPAGIIKNWIWRESKELINCLHLYSMSGLCDIPSFTQILLIVVNNLLYHDSAANHEKFGDAKYNKRAP